MECGPQNVNVYITDTQDDVKVSHHSIEILACAVVDFEQNRYDEVNIHLVDKETISQIHNQYFNDPSPTDCISFPLTLPESPGSYHHMGDVFVCPQVAKEFSSEQGGDLFEEISLYVTHGLLHLMGYDDINEADCLKMRDAERKHMENLKDSGRLLKSC